MAAASVYMVLSLGAFAGGIVKGVTGFGNAIINLLVWVSFTAAGVDAGNLSLAVLADSLGCLVCSVPLLLMTAAHKTADWRLVVTLLIFTTAGAPIGAALLMHLPVRWVELVMACVLLLVICLHVKLHSTLLSAFREWRARRRSGAYSGLLEADAAGRSTRGPSPELDAPTAAGQGGVDPDTSLHLVAVDCLPAPLPATPGPNAADPRRCAAHADGFVAIPESAEAAAALLPPVEAECDKPGDEGSGSFGRSGAWCQGNMVRHGSMSGAAGGEFACSCSSSASQPKAAGEQGGPGMEPGPIKNGDDGVPVHETTDPVGGDINSGAQGAADVGTLPSQYERSRRALFQQQGEVDEGTAAAIPCGQHASAGAALVPDTQPLLGKDTPASDAMEPPSKPRCSRCGAASDDRAGENPEPCSLVRGPAAIDDPECGGANGGNRRGGIWVRLRGWAARQDLREMRRILLVGSVAGCASGVMGGMTGIGGPPIMFMYEKLKVPKEVVRGTNAVNNVLQVRLVSYIVMGVFRREDLPLFAVTSLVGLVGVFGGNALAGRLDQRGFSRVLVALMVVCCALLFASAAGVKGRAVHK